MKSVGMKPNSDDADNLNAIRDILNMQPTSPTVILVLVGKLLLVVGGVTNVPVRLLPPGLLVLPYAVKLLGK